MTNLQKWILLILGSIFSIGIFLHAFTGRFVWIPGQENVHGVDYLPKVLDTWTGKAEGNFDWLRK